MLTYLRALPIGGKQKRASGSFSVFKSFLFKSLPVWLNQESYPSSWFRRSAAQRDENGEVNFWQRSDMYNVPSFKLNEFAYRCHRRPPLVCPILSLTVIYRIKNTNNNECNPGVCQQNHFSLVILSRLFHVFGNPSFNCHTPISTLPRHVFLHRSCTWPCPVTHWIPTPTRLC